MAKKFTELTEKFGKLEEEEVVSKSQESPEGEEKEAEKEEPKKEDEVKEEEKKEEAPEEEAEEEAKEEEKPEGEEEAEEVIKSADIIAAFEAVSKSVGELKQDNLALKTQVSELTGKLEKSLADILGSTQEIDPNAAAVEAKKEELEAKKEEEKKEDKPEEEAKEEKPEGEGEEEEEAVSKSVEDEEEPQGKAVEYVEKSADAVEDETTTEEETFDVHAAIRPVVDYFSKNMTDFSREEKYMFRNAVGRVKTNNHSDFDVQFLQEIYNKI